LRAISFKWCIFCGPKVNYKFEVLDKHLNPIPGLYAAGLTAGGTNGKGIFNATVLSNVGLALSSWWIAGDNATTVKPSYVPADMDIESEIGVQRLLKRVNSRFPRVGAFVMKMGFWRAFRKKRSGQ
jgi:hypothetical protein